MAAPEIPDGSRLTGRDVLMLFNANHDPREFLLPAVAKGTRWRLFVDTAAETPGDIYPKLDGPRLPVSGRLTLPDRTMRIYVAID